MKRVTIALVCLAVVAGAQDMRVTTKDGKIVTGKVSTKKLKIKTEFGTATVDVAKILSVTFGKPDVIVTKGDHELRGRISLSSLKVGKQSFKRAQLVELLVASAGPDFTGTWRTTFGPMKLKQTGLTVKGTWGVGYPNSIEGKVKGRRLTFTYREPNGQGSGWYELWPDGRHFKGEYAIGNNKGSWGGFLATHKRAELKPGAITSGVAKSMVKYHVRVPKNFDPSKQYPAVLIMHGSNMNTKAYVEGNVSNWGEEFGEEFIFIGVDGEKMSPAATPEFERYNYYYINYSGPDWGSPAIRRQSPVLVAEAIEEIREFVPISKLFVGGHSQGGYMSWFFVMYFPELVDGVFPVSGAVVVQCEPHVFADKPDLMKKQRQVPVAIVHGTNDSAVEFGSATYAEFLVMDGGFPRARLFDKKTGHMYAGLPVDKAVRWLQAMSSDDPAALIAFAETSIQQKRYRDAGGALARAETLKGADQAKIAAMRADIEKKAAGDAAKLLKKIKGARNGKWVPDFFEFRNEFGLTKSAEPVLAAYASLRKKHEKPANDLFGAARRERDKAARDAKYKEIRDKYYASRWYFLVSRWVK
ncbi:MAG: alpha/beta fold hydrolase [Planctomycetota bacterium]